MRDHGAIVEAAIDRDDLFASCIGALAAVAGAELREKQTASEALKAKQEADSARLASGVALVAKKATVKHGQWLPTLKALGVSERTASRYMALAGHVEEPNRPRPEPVADLKPASRKSAPVGLAVPTKPAEPPPPPPETSPVNARPVAPPRPFQSYFKDPPTTAPNAPAMTPTAPENPAAQLSLDFTRGRSAGLEDAAQLVEGEAAKLPRGDARNRLTAAARMIRTQAE